MPGRAPGALVSHANASERERWGIDGFELALALGGASNPGEWRRDLGWVERVLPLTLGCRASVRAWDQAERLFTVESDGPCELALRSYYFPGWKAEISVDDATSPVEVRTNPESGGLLVSAPAGESHFRVWFASGASTVLGGVLSVAGLIVCVVLGRRRTSVVTSEGR